MGRPAGAARVSNANKAVLRIRIPRAEEAPAIFRLIEECPPLDPNSRYCNLLQCTHFAETCVVAERGGTLAGWISAYRVPAAPHELFVWQVAVAPWARGTGVAARMLDVLMARPACRDITRLSASITDGNAPSRALFASFARRCGVPMSERPWFERDRHFDGSHETEHLLSIGPLPASATTIPEDA